jgi:uncharacterized protein
MYYFVPSDWAIVAALNEFCRFELRTTDVHAARAFYSNVFGHDRAVIWPLHEQALARGARPHWVGYLGVADVEVTLGAFVAQGAQQLGPAPAAAGARAVVIKDPGGALLALSSPPAPDAVPSLEVSTHVLNTGDIARAIAVYRDLFGWEISERVEQGALRQFCFRPGGESVGVFADIAQRPGVHPHWLFFFDVDDLERAMTAASNGGALVVDPIVTLSGERLLVCDDPQGAAFGLRERRRG